MPSINFGIEFYFFSFPGLLAAERKSSSKDRGKQIQGSWSRVPNVTASSPSLRLLTDFHPRKTAPLCPEMALEGIITRPLLYLKNRYFQRPVHGPVQGHLSCQYRSGLGSVLWPGDTGRLCCLGHFNAQQPGCMKPRNWSYTHLLTLKSIWGHGTSEPKALGLHGACSGGPSFLPRSWNEPAEVFLSGYLPCKRKVEREKNENKSVA